MIAFPRSLLRWLTGPLARRTLALLLIAALWLAWDLWPPRPLDEWSAGDGSGLILSADGTTVAVPGKRIGENNHPLHVFDVGTGRERCRMPIQSGRLSANLSPDGRWLVHEDPSHRVTIWNASTGVLAVGADAVPGGIAVPVTFLPDGRRCLIGRRHHDLTLWDLNAGRAVATLPGAAVPGIVTPDGKTLITAGWESVRVWDAETGRPATLPRLPAEIEDWPYDLAMTRDGRRLAVVVRKTLPPPVNPLDRVVREVLLFDWPSGAAAGVLPLHDRAVIPLPDGKDTRVRFSADGRWLLVGGSTASAVWDLAADPPQNVTPRGLRRPERVSMRFTSGPHHSTAIATVRCRPPGR